MIRYRYRGARLLFVGINPHHGSYARGVPFSNNKMFWYLLSQAGLVKESRDALRDDHELQNMYREKFTPVYKLGFVNMIDRPTRDISELRKGEEIPGRKRLLRVIKKERPDVVCFVGKVTYARYAGATQVTYGWKDDICGSRAYVMHSPSRGEASVRVRELKLVKKAAARA